MGSALDGTDMKKAVFLDRDGTVNEEVGYMTDLAKLRLIRGAGAAIRRLNQAGFSVILVTNQSGVARGYFPESLVHEAHDRLDAMLAVRGCPDRRRLLLPASSHGRQSSQYTRDCDCRKPRTGLIDRAVKDLDIDIARSYMVGDKWSDVELGHRAGVRRHTRAERVRGG